VATLLGLVVIEAMSRFFEGEPEPSAGLELTLQPYTMFSVSGHARNPVWRNHETKTDIPSQMRFNNLGFAEAGDFSFPVDQAFVKELGKKPEERLVVITGASVIQGVGATSNENTIAGQLQRALNEKQSRQRYRVVNLGMGSWIAYQEFIGLSIFGLPLRPDWIVVMDGPNDGAMVCSQGSGPGNPLQWAKMLYFAGGGQRTVYQGPVLQWLLEHSAAARLATGQKKPGPSNPIGQVFIDDDDPDPRFRMKLRGLRIADVDRQVDFYLQAQRNMVTLFSSANILLSSEPLLHENVVTDAYRKAFDFSHSRIDTESAKRRLAADLDAYMAKAKDIKCDSKVGPPTLGYFMARSALRLEQDAAAWAAQPSNRSVLYTNVEMLFPNRYGMRLPSFIDNAHLSDLGQRHVAEFFAAHILRTDLGMPFDPAHSSESVLADVLGVRLAGSAVVDAPPSKAAGKSIPDKASPDGVVVAQVTPDLMRLEEGPRTGVHQVTWSDVHVTSTGESTLSIDAYFGQVDVVRLEIRDTSSSYGWSTIDLGAQTISAGGNINNAHIQDLGRGWRRITLTIRFKSDVASVAFALMSLDGGVSEYPGVGRSITITRPTVASNGS
jgi:hypothetical protein